MLTLTNIQKTFAPGTVNEKKALCGIDLHLEAGDFVTVLGSNGAGKSTLFGAIAGSFRPDTGTVVLDGQDITNMPDYRRSKCIGRLFQDPLRGTAPSMTIAENLALAYLRRPWPLPLLHHYQKGSGRIPGSPGRPGAGPGGPDEPPRRSALRRTAAGPDPADGHPGDPKAAAPGRAHCRIGSCHGGKGAGADEENRGREPHHLPDDHPQRPLGPWPLATGPS